LQASLFALRASEEIDQAMAYIMFAWNLVEVMPCMLRLSMR